MYIIYKYPNNRKSIFKNSSPFLFTFPLLAFEIMKYLIKFFKKLHFTHILHSCLVSFIYLFSHIKLLFPSHAKIIFIISYIFDLYRENDIVTYQYNVYKYALSDFPDNALLYVIVTSAFPAPLPKSIDYTCFIALNRIEWSKQLAKRWLNIRINQITKQITISLSDFYSLHPQMNQRDRSMSKTMRFLAAAVMNKHVFCAII